MSSSAGKKSAGKTAALSQVLADPHAATHSAASENADPPIGGRQPATDTLSAGLRWLLLAAALLPAAASLWVTSSPGTMPALKLAGGTRGLLFETYLYHYGLDAIEPQGMLLPEFRFANIGDHEITLTRMEPSCGCLAPRWTSQIIAPGERGAILVPIRTAGETAGPHEYLVQLGYRDGDNDEKQLTLTVKVTLPELQIRVEPKALMVYSNSNVPTKHQVVVTDYRGERIQITGIDSSSAWVTAALSADVPAPVVRAAGYQNDETVGDEAATGAIEQAAHSAATGDGLHRAAIEVMIPEGVPPGRHNAVIRIHTTDAEFRTLTVPVLIMGPQTPERAVVSVIPPALRIPAATQGTAAAGTDLSSLPRGRAIVEVPESWSVSHADCDPDSCSVTYEVVPGPKPSMQQIQIVVTQREAIPLSLQTGVISLHFAEQDQLVTIPVTFAHAPESSSADR